MPRLAPDRRDRVDQGFQLSDVRGVGAGQRGRQRNASAVGYQMVFTARLRAIRRVWTSLLTPAQGAHRRTVDSRTRPVDLIGGIQLGQQKLVQSLPDTSLVPVAQSPPASHTTAAAHLLRQVFPVDAGLEYEQDADQRLAIVDRFSSGIAEPSQLGRRQQGLDSVPELIR